MTSIHGGVYLEKLNRGNTMGTHRVVFFGDAANWGMKEGQKESNQVLPPRPLLLKCASRY